MANLQMVADNTTEVTAFLDYLYEGLEGYVAGATKRVVTGPDNKPEIDFKRESFQWPLARDILADWIVSNSRNCEVYVAPAIFSEASGRREFFKATNVAWADFDGQLPTTHALIGIPEPTLRVQSSGPQNEHWYWKFDSPVTDASVLEGINRSLTYQLGADISGWDANQILRPPGTFNHKRDKPVVVVGRSTSTVEPLLFKTLEPVTQAVVSIDNDIPDVTDVVLSYAWPKEAATLYRMRPADSVDRSALLMKLGYFLAQMKMSDVEMFSVLRNADDRWGKFKDRTDRNRRLADLIGKARSKYPIEVVLPENIVPIFGLQSFLNTEIEIEWVVPGLLQRQGYMLLTGESGVGKTQWSLRWAICMALGISFLGHEISKPQRILFWSLEMGHPDLKYFLDTMCQGMSAEQLLLLEENLLIAPLGESFYLNVERTQQQFEEILQDFPVDGIMIDSMGSSASGALTDETTVKDVMDFNDHIRNTYGVWTWIIHHMRKAQGDNKKPNKLSDVYGNIYLTGRATSVYCLWKVPNAIEVIPLKKRLAAAEEPWTITRFGNLDFIRKENISLGALKTGGPVLNLEDETPTVPKGMDF